MRWTLPLFLPFLLLPHGAAAQTWNSDPALALARRAIDRRAQAAGDTALRDYKAQAHGFVFFLGQMGDGLNAPPRLIKADQLELEVYWKAPGASKQRIVGWRDRAELPTDINYHRDHLGIVQNNFGPLIRLGEGDEVRDVPHPLSPGGPLLYDYALGDTLVIALPGRSVRVVGLRVRPKDFDAPRIIGTLYVDAETAGLVRLAFNFTPKSYLESELEDVSIVLDNALWEGRFWLPYRQEIEIRRRATWIDMAVRGIIRGRWEIDNYQFNLGLAASWFAGEEITAVPKVERDSFPWHEPLVTAMRAAAAPVRQSDLDAVRTAAARLVGREALTGLHGFAFGASRVSDLVHVNRVEGLTPGGGVRERFEGRALELRAAASYGFADHRVKGAGGATLATDRGTFDFRGFREVRDIGDVAIVAPLINSMGAQEFGDDAGDYYLADGARAAVRRGSPIQLEWQAAVGREWIGSLARQSTSASGAYRPNPALGGAAFDLLQLGVRRAGAGLAVPHDLAFELRLEAGRRDAGATYLRLWGSGHLLVPLDATRLLLEVQGGAGTSSLPRHRGFTLGGRGTLLGDPFRAWGGRRLLLGHVEWRIPVPVGVHVGGFALPVNFTLAPYLAAGRTADPVSGTPWLPTPDTRVTVGLGLECLGLLRVDAGYGTATRRVRLAIDVTRDFRGIL